MDNINKWLSLTANISVMVGIIFLAIELNQNSAINKTNSVLSIRQGQQTLQLLSLQNHEFAALNVKLLNNGELSAVEQRQTIDFTFYLFNQSRMAYFQYQNGLIGEDDLRILLAPFRFWIVRSQSMNSVWQGISSNNGEPEFINYINDFVAEND